MKSNPTFGLMFRFMNEITRRDAAELLRIRRRHRYITLRMTPGHYFFDGLILHTRP